MSNVFSTKLRIRKNINWKEFLGQGIFIRVVELEMNIDRCIYENLMIDVRRKTFISSQKPLELFHIENSFENECQLIIDRYNTRFRERYLYFFFFCYLFSMLDLTIRIVIDTMIT